MVSIDIKHARRGVWLSIAGALASGKSTLLKLLGETNPGSILIQEDWESNPYLKDSYEGEDPSLVAILSQFWFLDRKHQQIEEIKEIMRRKILVSQEPHALVDFSQAAVMHDEQKISDEDWRRYVEKFRYLSSTFPHPTLLIYLSATDEHIMERIKARGRDFEQQTSIEHVQRLIQYIEQQILERERRNPLSVLRIDTNPINIVTNPHDRWLVLFMIQERLNRLFQPPVKKARKQSDHPKVIRRRMSGKR